MRPSSAASSPEDNDLKSGQAAFAQADFRDYWLARILGALAIDMHITAVGWQIYALTSNPLDLGLVGLVQILPFFVLFPLAGIAADRWPRKRVLSACIAVQAVCAMAFCGLTATGAITVPAMLLILSFFGLSRAFQSPTQQAIVPGLVPPAALPNALAWNATASQAARIAGPGIAGVMIMAGEVWVYGAVALLLLASSGLTFRIRAATRMASRTPLRFGTVFAGFQFIWRRPALFGALAVDLVAVLLGGATALLPIYAKDILQVGPWGFGLLRGAHMLGALSGALYFTQRPIRRHAGHKLLLGVALFGLSIVVFGLSTHVGLSLVALWFLGAADSVSAFIRSILVQFMTPNDMRGRVSAVSSVFIGASNELGEFESGVTAAWWGVVPAVVVGGIGAIAAAALFAYLFPQLRRIDTLTLEALRPQGHHEEAHVGKEQQAPGQTRSGAGPPA
jgi:MFS family permease